MQASCFLWIRDQFRRNVHLDCELEQLLVRLSPIHTWHKELIIRWLLSISPNMLLGDIPPEVKPHSVILLKLNWFFQRKQNWEPGEHAWRAGGRKDGDHYFFVEETLKVPSKTMQNAIWDYLEAEFLISSVIYDTSVIGMSECEEGLRRGQLKPILCNSRIIMD